ncbi:MAG TPA: hypothetical protein VNY84_02555, partial [Acidimicrobiales bacterium]|nr:hypothetical protein [Acidimicrobiales bacterium]
MQTTPAMVGRRYSPLIALAVVQLLLVVVAPSVPGKGTAGGTGLVAGGSGGSGGAGGGLANGTATGANGTAGGTGGVGGSGTGVGGANGAGSLGTGASGANGVLGAIPQAGAAGGDRSHCDASGHQIGPTFYMPPCSAVWHGGNNGGATMNGVFADHINYIFYRVQPNAEVNAILNQEGLAATDESFCEAVQAFHNEVNKRWEFYGRKLVSLDGPGNHRGSGVASNCHFPYFQGQCSLTPPDPPCERAEADLIASMKPAYVIAPVTGSPAFYNELARDHIIVAGGQTEPDSYHQDDAPYYYDSFMNGTRDVTLTAEYYCKQLQGKPVQFAGPDVKSPAGSLTPPKRKLAIVYPQTNGDPSYTLSANLFIKLVTGGMCGSPADGVKGYPYESDITRAEQQSTTTVAGLKSSGVTTVVFF